MSNRDNQLVKVAAPIERPVTEGIIANSIIDRFKASRHGPGFSSPLVVPELPAEPTFPELSIEPLLEPELPKEPLFPEAEPELPMEPLLLVPDALSWQVGRIFCKPMSGRVGVASAVPW